MTHPTHGADVLALRSTAQQMYDAAEELIATDLRVSGGLWSLTWNGPDAMRARQAWDSQHGPALYAAAGALAESAEQLLAEADDQEQTSAPGALPVGPPPGMVASAVRSTLAAEVFALRTVLDGLTPSAETVGRIRSAVGEAIGVAGLLDSVNTVGQHVPVPPGVSAGIGALSAAQDVSTLRAAWQEGDLSGVVRSLGSLETAAVATRFPVAGAAAGVAWYTGWEIGEAANTVMEGTRFERNYRDRNDAILDILGPWGMLVTPGTLIVAGAETAWQTVTDSDSDSDSDQP